MAMSSFRECVELECVDLKDDLLLPPPAAAAAALPLLPNAAE